MASRMRLGCPRSNMSKTNVTVTIAGSAASHGPGLLSDPLIAFESCAVIHHAVALRMDKQT